MTDYDAAATTYNASSGYDGAMAFMVGARWRQTATGPFFGPRFQGFVPINGLSALAESAKYTAFMHECSVRNKKVNEPSYSGPWGVSLIAPLGCRFALKSASSATYTGGWPVNDDAGQAQPFPLGKAYESTYGERSTYIGVFLSGGSYPCAFINMPKPSAYSELAYQDCGQNPATSDAFNDGHAFFVSRSNRREMDCISYQPGAANGTGRMKSSGANTQMFLNKDRLGNPVYERALWQSEVVAAALGEAAATGRFPAGPPLDDHPYGPFSSGWRCGNNTTGAITDEDAQSTIFGYANGAGVPVYDYIPRYEEFEKGHINHALLATFVNGSDAFAPPAFRTDGLVQYTETPVWYDGATNVAGSVGVGQQVLAPKYGWMLRLKASALQTCENHLRNMGGDGRREAMILLRAMNEYGIMPHDKFSGSFDHASNPNGAGNPWPLTSIADSTAFTGYNPPGHYMFSLRLSMDERMPVSHASHPNFPYRLNPIAGDGSVAFTDCNAYGGHGVCLTSYMIEQLVTVHGRLGHTDFEYVDATTLMSDRTANPYSMECA